MKCITKLATLAFTTLTMVSCGRSDSNSDNDTVQVPVTKALSNVLCMKDGKAVAYGSGVKTSDGKFLTAKHVVEGCDSILIKTAESDIVMKMREFTPSSDVVVLEKVYEGKELQDAWEAKLSLEKTSVSSLKGDTVTIIATQQERFNGVWKIVNYRLVCKVTSDIIYQEANETYTDGLVYSDVECDQPILRGMSGGAVMNRDEKVVGIASQVYILSPTKGRISIL